jgi:hypothetical protein
MKASEREALALYESLAVTIGPDAGGDFLVELRCLMKRYLRDYEQRRLDDQAARLSRIGSGAIALRQGCHRVTAWRRKNRGLKNNVAAPEPDATSTS